MKQTEHKKCCEGCKKGQPGLNETCKAKLLLEQVDTKQKNKQLKV